MWQRFLFQRVKERASLRFNEKKCLRERYKHSNCDKCVVACQSEALSMKDGKIHLDKDLCTSCGQCTHACPTDALYYESEMMNKYESRISQKDAVTFTCEKQKSKQGHDVAFPCLSALTPEYLMTSELYDKRSEVFCDSQVCKTCEVNWSPNTGLKWLEDWNRQSILKDKVPVINQLEQKTGRTRTYNRRELFKMSSNETKGQIADLFLDSYKEVSNLKEKIGQTEKRKYLMTYLQKNKESLHLDKSELLSTKLQVAKLKVSKECTVCQKCSSICPTGALQVVEAENTSSLQFYTEQCVDCDICEKVCDFIEKKPIKHLAEILENHTLQIVEQDKCPTCGDKKNVKNNLCEDCEIKESRRRSLLSDW
ncbi:NADH-quinone oxidoreductase subunit I [Salipaludibacillus daqingensis]|uniref:NADH-quinone oxidoreductase subunit I n=1 Tax=Salipaludibacillus daqingensis TaxID=3041001 RepID=UPI0024765DC8|nr:4Fe-4S dicluster domain-containing protein [Salipaludibacillus daqingensis]